MTTRRQHSTARSGGSNTAPAVELGPYVAWLSSRLENESARRRCRRVAEAYLEWLWADGGPVSSRRSRFLAIATSRLPLTRADVEYALDRLAEYRAVVAQTLPVDA